MSDRIVKSVVLRSPPYHVWPALTDSKAFGSWFGAVFDGPFTPGAHVTGRITPTQMDADVAKAQEPYKDAPIDIVVDRMDPLRLFSFRWHPHAIDRSMEDSSEPSTLVEFALEEVDHGTRLTVTESGFERLPEAHRDEAYRSNSGGWEKQLGLVRSYVDRH